MKRKVITFTETGEVRLPKKGEWFLSTDGDIREALANYVEASRPIYTREETTTEWKPEYGDEYQVIDTTMVNQITTVTWNGHEFDFLNYERGNCYPLDMDLTDKINAINEILKK